MTWVTRETRAIFALLASVVARLSARCLESLMSLLPCRLRSACRHRVEIAFVLAASLRGTVGRERWERSVSCGENRSELEVVFADGVL